VVHAYPDLRLVRGVVVTAVDLAQALLTPDVPVFGVDPWPVYGVNGEFITWTAVVAGGMRTSADGTAQAGRTAATVSASGGAL
jgi:hypothetical protein